MTIRMPLHRTLLTWLALLGVLMALTACGDSQGAIDLETLRPRATVDVIRPGGTYEITFEPKIDDLQISAGDTPEGISADVKPGTSSGTYVLNLTVDQDANIAGAVDIPINVVDGTDETVVLWPFTVEQNG